MRLLLEIAVAITMGVLPIVINKSTEVFHLDWVGRYLREIWFGLFVFFLIYWVFTKPEITEAVVNLHSSGWIGYIVVGLSGAIFFCGFWWFTGKVATNKAQDLTELQIDKLLHFSLVQVTSADSMMFLDKPLDEGQSLYRFRLTSLGKDLTDIKIALDLPALLAAQPITIDRSGTENLTAKAAFSAYTRTTPQNETERISGLSNTAIIEMSRLRKTGQIDIGLITIPVRPNSMMMATAPDGALMLAMAPAYGRYGSLSVKYDHLGAPSNGEGKTEAHSFPIVFPIPNSELIDSATELRPWSRSALQLLTQDDILKAEKDHVNLKVEQHFE